MDAYAVLRVKTKKTELVYTGRSSTLEPRKHSLSDAVELSPEERLALFRLILIVQEKGQHSLKWTVKELADVCGSNVASVGSLIPKLKGSGLIEPDIMRPITHGGRSSYIVTSECKYLLKQSAWIEDYPIRALQRRVLLPEEGYNPEKKKRGGFSRSNRWLLAVLLEYSNLMGVVDDLGGAELRSLTGLTKERLRAQILQLKCLGFLHAVSPGISGSPFFGIKPSVYYLNLHHPYFESERLPGFTILIRNGIIDETNFPPDIEMQESIRREVLLKSRKPIAQLQSVQQTNFYTSKYLMNHVNNPYLPHLESVVGRMTSFFLSEDFGKHVTKYDCKAMELLSSMVANLQSKELEEDTSDFKKQKEVVYEISERRMLEVSQFLLKYSGINIDELRNYKYMLLPVGYIKGNPRIIFAIEVFPKEKNNKAYKCLFINVKMNEIGKRFSQCESTKELTAEQRFAFGFIDKQMLEKVKALNMPVFDGRPISDSPLET